jgi:hypothetical protein
VREDFAHQPACQVLEVACPDLLYRVALSDPRKNGVYQVAEPTEEGAPFLGWSLTSWKNMGPEALHSHLPTR